MTCAECGGPLEPFTGLRCCLACIKAAMEDVTVESVGELLEGLLDREARPERPRESAVLPLNPKREDA